ncbi:hypothetical protein [Endozoicomonas arenosclerae]|uniref:hypothetical protein n=1 Tax=Endozoicomonas arenosclerae TaxID=1633495 RepID=UPI0007866108|nr:hypothetical protein [Endozoicomonas arenosclerae]
MYTRFTVNYINKQSGMSQGILGAAFKLKKDGRVPPPLKDSFELSLSWFQTAFLTPDIFDQTSCREGICWFKDTQTDLINKVRELIPTIERCGLKVSEQKSRDPGKVIYEDDHQVVAIPIKAMEEV